MDRHADMQTDTHRDRRTKEQAHLQKEDSGQTDGQTDRQTAIQGQTDRQQINRCEGDQGAVHNYTHFPKPHMRSQSRPRTRAVNTIQMSIFV